MKLIKRIAAVCICAALLCGWACASSQSQAETADRSLAEQIGCPRGQVLSQTDFIPAGHSISDWLAFALAVCGVKEQYGPYLSRLEQYVSDRYSSKGCLNKNLATEYHRIALTVLALGGDPTAFGTDGSGKPVNLVADGTWDFAAGVDKQGVNGAIYALILLDSMDWTIPEDSGFSRENLIGRILDAQEENGGFGFLPGSTDVDMTAMALTSLAPHADACRADIDRALDFLAEQMDDACHFSCFGEANAESCAQVIIALCSLGIDPEQDGRFIRNGRTIVGSLEEFREENGLYCHVRDGGSDVMATEQALLAFAALDRMRSGEERIYSFSDVRPADGAGKPPVPVPIIIPVFAALCAAAVALSVIRNRRRKRAGNHRYNPG